MRQLRLLTFAFATLCAATGASAQEQNLQAHLVDAAARFDVKLAYSPSQLPDTSFFFEVRRGDRFEATFERLTEPFGFHYELIGRQLVLSVVRRVRFNVSGFVEDSITGERLIGATVYASNQRRGTVSNGYGYFSLAELIDADTLVVRYVGYAARSFTVARGTRSALVVELRPELVLGTVEVVASSATTTQLPISGTYVTPSALKTAALLVGTADVNAWLGAQVGVQTSAAGFKGYSLQGADPSHNLVLLDDATLYLPSHAAGYLGSIPGNAIRSVRLFKDPGNARYGDRVGGVLDIRLKEGSRESRKTTITAGIDAIAATTEGPLGKGSYFVSARRGLFDVWLGAARRVLPSADLPAIDFEFYDVAVKVNQRITGRHHLYASVYAGRDRYDDSAEASYVLPAGPVRFVDQSLRLWSNGIASLRHNVALVRRAFLNTTATYSQFSYRANDFYAVAEQAADSTTRYSWLENTYGSRLRDFGLKSDVNVATGPRTSLTFGIDAVVHQFNVGTRDRREERGATPAAPSPVASAGLPQITTLEASGYTSVELRPTDRLQLELGVRLSSQTADTSSFTSLLPRLSVAYQPLRAWRLTASAGFGRQYIHQVSTQNPGLALDLWVPSVYGLRPQRVRYASVSARYKTDRAVEVGLGGYAQRYRELARFANESFDPSVRFDEWVKNVRRGRGYAAGMTLDVTAPAGQLDASARYTLGTSQRWFADERGELQRERYRLDRRHYAVLGLGYRAGVRWRLATTYRVGTGLPTRVPLRSPVGPPLPPTSAPLTNSYDYGSAQRQLPPYQTLDVSARYGRSAGKRTYELNFGLQNIYARRNPLFLNLQRIDDVGEGEAPYQFTQVYLPPLLPFLDYSVTF